MSCGVMCTLACQNDLVIRIARRSNFPFTDESNERAVLGKVISSRTRHGSTSIAFQRCHPEHEVYRVEEGLIDRRTDTPPVGAQ